VISLALYGAFLAIQTGRHRRCFISDGNDATKPHELPRATRSLRWHAALLLAYILPVVLLAKQLAQPIDYFIETLQVLAARAAA
jgi:Ca2+:H+ antiporter